MELKAENQRRFLNTWVSRPQNSVVFFLVLLRNIFHHQPCFKRKVACLGCGNNNEAFLGKTAEVTFSNWAATRENHLSLLMSWTPPRCRDDSVTYVDKSQQPLLQSNSCQFIQTLSTLNVSRVQISLNSALHFPGPFTTDERCRL